jgi:hypothetical protein
MKVADEVTRLWMKPETEIFQLPQPLPRYLVSYTPDRSRRRQEAGWLEPSNFNLPPNHCLVGYTPDRSRRREEAGWLVGLLQ